MAGTRYIVELDLQQKGDFGTSKLQGNIGKLQGGVSKLSDAFHTIGSGGGIFSSVVGVMDSIVAKVADVGMGIAKWGAAAAVGGATYGVVSLNNELEKTRISLGTIFSVQGKSANLTQGLDIASDQIAKMRKDAAALPGEFEDLVGIFRTAAIPGFQAGLSVDKMREMSAKIMAAGAVTGLPMDQVAREAAMLMSGRAGAHNVFGMRLMGLSGESAKAFNQMTPEQRVAKMATELDKFAPAINEFGKSFEGISTSFIDNVKQFGQVATSGLFTGVKEVLGDINDWFSTNKVTIKEWAEHIAFKLYHAFYVAVDAVKEWWPYVSKFAENAYAKLSEVWEKISPAIEKFGATLKDALKDPGSIDKLITLGKVYLGAKGAMGIATTIGQIGSTIGGITSLAKLAGFGKAAGGAASAAGEAAEVGLGSKVLGGLVEAGGGGLMGFGAALVDLIPQVALAAAALYTLKVASEQSSEELKAQFDFTNLSKLNDANMKFVETLTGLDFGFHTVEDSSESLAMAMENSAAAIAVAGDSINKNVNDFWLALAKQGPGGGQATAEREKKNVKHPGGGGGTNIQKVEVVVTSNQEPSRIARAVAVELSKKVQRSGRSPDVANYARVPGT